MKNFDFFFGLKLSQTIFSHTDSLSETLQKAGMSATSGQYNANLTKDALKKIGNDDRTSNTFIYAMSKQSGL